MEGATEAYGLGSTTLFSWLQEPLGPLFLWSPKVHLCLKESLNNNLIVESNTAGEMEKKGPLT